MPKHFPIGEILLFDLVLGVYNIFNHKSERLDDVYHPDNKPVRDFLCHWWSILKLIFLWANAKMPFLHSRTDFLALPALADTEMDCCAVFAGDSVKMVQRFFQILLHLCPKVSPANILIVTRLRHIITCMTKKLREIGSVTNHYWVCLFVLFEFRSFRPVRTIAGRGGVIGPLPRPE